MSKMRFAMVTVTVMATVMVMVMVMVMVLVLVLVLVLVMVMVMAMVMVMVKVMVKVMVLQCTDGEDLDVQDEVRHGGDAEFRRAFHAIRELPGDCQSCLLTDPVI
jgi:hypothetical protein